jgi:hypothetical protein
MMATVTETMREPKKRRWIVLGWGPLAPLLPSERRGKPRVDDRRVLSGIVHVLRSGCPWRHAPRE